MSKEAVHAGERAGERTRISVSLTPELNAEITKKAKETGLSMNRTILRLLSAGLEAEHDQKRRLEEMLHRYRECPDPQEAQRIGDELGAMIFGR